LWRARGADLEAKIDIEPHMHRVYHFLAGCAPEADAAWVRRKLGLA